MNAAQEHEDHEAGAVYDDVRERFGDHTDHFAEELEAPAPRLASREAIERYALAGNATFTIQSSVTGTRYTYRVRAPKDGLDVRESIRFVSVLTGPDNSADYAYIGVITPRGDFRHGKKSRLSRSAPSVRAFEWFWLNAGDPRVAVYHEGRCGRCGRLLTVPASIESGLGPECAGRGA